MDRINSFGAISDENAKVLILGSVPSVKSLDAGQFYACRTEAFLKDRTTDVENLLPLILSEKEVQDIDTSQDWEMAELKYRLLYGLK